MKKFIGLIFLLSASVCKADSVDTTIVPTLVTPVSITTTIVAPGAGYRNCLTNVVLNSSSTIELNILDGGTTIYNIPLSTTSASLPAWSTVSASWSKDDPLCADFNKLMSFTVMNSTGSYSPYRLHYRGQIRKKVP